MPERVNSFARPLPGAILIPLVAVTIAFDGPVWADDACIEQPPLPVAENAGSMVHNYNVQYNYPYNAPYNHVYSVPYNYTVCHTCHATATEVLVWNVRYDRVSGRKCWILLDGFGRDVTAAHMRSHAAPAAAPAAEAPSTFSSKLAALFGNFNFWGMSENFWGMSANAAPESSAPLTSPPPGSAVHPPHKLHDETAKANKTDGVGRLAHRATTDANAPRHVARVSIREKDRELFEEFLRWREREKVSNTVALPATRP